MSRIVFLIEEYSMKVFLDGLLPRVIGNVPFICVPHEGKQDLEKSIPKKLRAWREPGVRFVILRDNDGEDCLALKERLNARCQEGNRPDCLVRIACQELESWYLGDPEALAVAFENEKLKGISKKPRYSVPDSVQQPSRLLERLIPEFQKVLGARRIAPLIEIDRCQSRSFRVLIAGIERLVAEMGLGPVDETSTSNV